MCHATHDQFVLLEGVFLGTVLAGRQERVEIRLPAAGILTRVRVPDGQHAIRHFKQRIADPGGESGIQRMETDLGVGGSHGSFEGGCPMDCLGSRFILCRAAPNRPIALDDTETLRVVDAGHQVGDIHLGVVQAA